MNTDSPAFHSSHLLTCAPRSAGEKLAASRPDLVSRLSDAQGRVLGHLLDGLTEPQIANSIGRSRHTVHDHTKAIYAALNVRNRVQLVLEFSKEPLAQAG
ncbi:MAG: helix-turn-helix transcriptional regulator [Phycisphaerales bacterium]|jgi:DNA-binding NarL/FixJ family response regulator|nr:helix-turn-helix transcriptional regulator [Phycisphaerales bacterium]